MMPSERSRGSRAASSAHTREENRSFGEKGVEALRSDEVSDEGVHDQKGSSCDEPASVVAILIEPIARAGHRI
jgi:hypothetical protein